MTVIRMKRGIGRQAFTLVELLVSLALIAFIMSILSAAFGAAAKAFSDLKAQGDLAEKGRGVMTMLRRDLSQQHFAQGNSYTLLSQFTGPPNGGFFRIYQDQQIWVAGSGGPPNGSPMASWQAPQAPGPTEIPTFVTTRSMLHFSSFLPGLLPGDFYVTDLQTAFAGNQLLDPNYAPTPFTTLFNQDQRYQPASSSVFKSPWAEIAWWLSPSLNPDGSQAFTTTDPGQTAQPLYTLRRRQRLIWPEGQTSLPSAGNTGTYDEVSIPTGMSQVNGWAQTTIPPFRFAMNSGAAFPQGQPSDTTNIYPNATTGRVADIVVDGVLSFDVRVLLLVTPAVPATMTTPAIPAVMASTFVDLYDASVQQYANSTSVAGYGGNNTYFTSTTTGNPRVFDTWSNQKITVGTTTFDYSPTSTTPWSTPGSQYSIPLYKNPTTGQIIQIQAIQVTLRLYDFKSQTTRQVSMVQAL